MIYLLALISHMLPAILGYISSIPIKRALSAAR